MVVVPLAEGLVDRAAELERIVADGSREPGERAQEIQKIRDSLKFGLKGEPAGSVADQFTTLIGRADSYIGALNLQREGASLSRVFERAAVAEGAAIRAELEGAGVAPADLDAAGLPEPERLREAEEDGTLAESPFGPAKEVLAARLGKGKEFGESKPKPKKADPAHGEFGHGEQEEGEDAPLAD